MSKTQYGLTFMLLLTMIVAYNFSSFNKLYEIISTCMSTMQIHEKYRKHLSII